jgi:hypothetical protein
MAEAYEYSKHLVRKAHPDAEIVLSKGGTMYMVKAGDRLLSGPKASIGRAWREALSVVVANAP